jgi:uncharacterized protein (TIGR02996 family)
MTLPSASDVGCPTMTAENAFLRSIINHPEDDNPRLIYADWLDEQGEVDRAEFIRVQCELEKMGPDRPVVTVYSISRRGMDTSPLDMEITTPIIERYQLNVPYVRHYIHNSSYESLVDALVWDLSELRRGDLFDVRCQSDFGGLFEIHDCVVEEALFESAIRDPTPYVRVRFHTNGPPDEHRKRREELRRREKELIDGDEPSGIHRHQLWFSPLGLITEFSDECQWTYRRGFVEEINCTPRVFLGGWCRRCRGIEQVWHDNNWNRLNACPNCRGTGRTKGYSKEIMTNTPLRVVRFTERLLSTAMDEKIFYEEGILKKEFPGIKFHFFHSLNNRRYVDRIIVRGIGTLEEAINSLGVRLYDPHPRYTSAIVRRITGQRVIDRVWEMNVEYSE